MKLFNLISDVGGDEKNKNVRSHVAPNASGQIRFNEKSETIKSSQ